MPYTWKVTLRHESHFYDVTVTISAPNIDTAKGAAMTMHPGFSFVSAVLQDA